MKHRLVFFLIVFSCAITLLYADETKNPLPTISAKTVGIQKLDGFFPFYWDAKTGKIWLEIDKWDTEFLYIDSLPAGIGSNDIGLDRGQLGETRVVKFYRSGPKVLLIQSNYTFRTTSSNPFEVQTVEESFAQSTLWGFETAAEDGNRVLVDATAFFLRDVHSVTATLKQTNQGDFRLDDSRSAFYLPQTKNFPQNTELEVMLTFVSEAPGLLVQEVVPEPRAITVREHHSFVQAPDANYRPRRLDPRAGFFGIQYMDFGTPLGEPLWQQFIGRHRLEKKDPDAAVSEAVKPIVYYVDSGAPEPIRSALMEGASWWNQAFEAIGYKNAFQVKLLPPDVDPMDVRYNVIQWVHRSTRGWSLGNAVVDPRTGEIIKGLVTLGSQRVRQDYLIAEGLLAPYETGKPVSPEMQEMALARLRQLAAHEVGHTLGLAHNFVASTANRASVMDYPHPLIKIRPDKSLDLSNAYAKGIGEWDKVTIAYGYSDFGKNADEKSLLNGIIQKAISRGLFFITDDDARPPGGAHPLAHLWDNGPDPAQELEHVLEIRHILLNQFSERNIREGANMSSLQETLVPVYLFHRYQTEAVAKLVGGLNYTYALRGDGQTAVSMIPPEQQRKALNSLLRTLSPEVLAMPQRIMDLIPPQAFSTPPRRELFPSHTAPAFDPLATAESAANITVGLLLRPERTARLVDYHARDKNFPGLDEVIDQILEHTWKAQAGYGYVAEIRRVVDNVVLYHLMNLAANESAAEQARAIAYLKLDRLKNWLTVQARVTKDEGQQAHYLLAIVEITRFQKDPKQIHVTKPLDPPPGAPIGCE